MTWSKLLLHLLHRNFPGFLYGMATKETLKERNVMKLIEALKKEKDLLIKFEDLLKKIRDNSAHLSYETPVYLDTKKQLFAWVQSAGDILKEIERIKVAILKTNLETYVTIKIGGNSITKSIAHWILRRRDLAAKEEKIWRSLTDRGLQDSMFKQSTGEKMEVKVVRYYDPKDRDEKILAYNEEPRLIDAKLEIINATTDLIE